VEKPNEDDSVAWNLPEQVIYKIKISDKNINVPILAMILVDRFFTFRTRIGMSPYVYQVGDYFHVCVFPLAMNIRPNDASFM